MINRLKTLFAPALLVAGLAACGGGSASYADAVDDAINSFCSRAFECMDTYPGTADQHTQSYGANEQACLDQLGPIVEEQTDDIEASIDAGRIVFNSGNASDCLDAAESASCDDYWTGTPPASCDMVLVGQVADGDACTISTDCAVEDSFCDETDLVCGPGGV